MAAIAFWFALLFASLPSEAQTVKVPDRPSEDAHVFDLGDMLSLTEELALEKQLQKMRDSLQAEIVIAIFDSLHYGNFDTAADKVARKWKIGKENKNQGVLVVLQKAGKKASIEVRGGIKNRLDKEFLKEALQNRLLPEMAEGKTFAALEHTLEAIWLKSGKSRNFKWEKFWYFGRQTAYACFVFALLFAVFMETEVSRKSFYSKGLLGGYAFFFLVTLATVGWEVGVGYVYFWQFSWIPLIVALPSLLYFHRVYKDGQRKKHLYKHLINKYLNDNGQWENLQKFYNPTEVSATLSELRKGYSDLGSRPSFYRVSNLFAELKKATLFPDKKFSERVDCTSVNLLSELDNYLS